MRLFKSENVFFTDEGTSAAAAVTHAKKDEKASFFLEKENADLKFIFVCVEQSMQSSERQASSPAKHKPDRQFHESDCTAQSVPFT